MARGGRYRRQPGQRLDEVAQALDRVHEPEEGDDLGVGGHAEPVAGLVAVGRAQILGTLGASGTWTAVRPNRSCSTRECPALVVSTALLRGTKRQVSRSHSRARSSGRHTPPGTQRGETTSRTRAGS